MNIVVLAGGLSPERNVSLSSGSLISSALRRKGHKVAMADVYEGVPDEKDLRTLFTADDVGIPTVGTVAPSPTELKKIIEKNGNRTELIGPNIIDLCKAADVVFLALHGDMGENGQLQATLDLFDITYTGSGYLGSAIAMNKDIAKKLMCQNGILTPEWIKYDFDCDYENSFENVLKDAEKLGYPLVVKPCSCGSSVGVSIVNDKKELLEALKLSAEYESSVIIEKQILGRELTQAYFDGKPLPPVEIIPKLGFYDYKNKYLPNATEEICPAALMTNELEEISNATVQGFKALCLCGYARFDYILDKDGKFFCLEANTLPGMTPTSLLPQEALAVGIDYDSLCEKLAYLALKKKSKVK